jgi:signal transduction histidine kinase
MSSISNLTREEALKQLSSDTSHLRLKAARRLTYVGVVDDIPILQKVLRIEAVSFVKRALEQAIERIGTDRGVTTNDSSEKKPDINNDQQAYNSAVKWVTRSLLHEIGHRFGAIKIEASKIITGYESSELKLRIDRLDSVLDGIEQLSKATVSESIKEFQLPKLIQELINEEISKHTLVKISSQGPTDLAVMGDPALLVLAICNALRNAIEATYKTDPVAPIIVSWGATEVEYWVTIVDQGSGITGPADAAFEIGSTTKHGHTGFGLAIARQAMRTIDGSITLQIAHSGGVRVEIRWFK